MTESRIRRLADGLGRLSELRSRRLWAATGYLASYLILGPAMFLLSLLTLVLTAVLNITLLGFPLLLLAAGLIRGCAHVERRRAGLVGDRVTAPYRPVPQPGVISGVRTRWCDPATLRDCVYLVLLLPPLLALDAAALLLWAGVLATALAPAWYWSVPIGGELLPESHSLALSVPAALVGLLLAPLCGRLVVLVGRLHATVADSLLGPRTDPLAEAKRVLTDADPFALLGSERSTHLSPAQPVPPG